VALLLGVLAGEDWRDPQWVRGEIRGEDYVQALSSDQSLKGIRAGLSSRASRMKSASQRSSRTFARRVRLSRVPELRLGRSAFLCGRWGFRSHRRSSVTSQPGWLSRRALDTAILGYIDVKPHACLRTTASR
jgi:hypothetical protein